MRQKITLALMSLALIAALIGQVIASSPYYGTSTNSSITSITPGVAAASLGKAEDAVAASADVGVAAFCVLKATATANAAVGDYATTLCDSTSGALFTSMTNAVPGVGATNLGKAEDAVHTTADTGVFVLGVESDTPTAKGANGDYAPYLVDSVGALWSRIYGATATGDPFKAEDAAHASGDVGVLGLFVRKAAAFTDLSAGATDGDIEPGQINLEGALRTSPTASATGGWDVYTNNDIDETTGTTTQQLKGSAGVLHVCTITNDTAATKEYVKFYNATALTGSAAGTEVPVITVPTYGVSTVTIPMDYYFSTGMTVAATTALVFSDTGAPAANAIVLNCTYK